MKIKEMERGVGSMKQLNKILVILIVLFLFLLILIDDYFKNGKWEKIEKENKEFCNNLNPNIEEYDYIHLGLLFNPDNINLTKEVCRFCKKGTILNRNGFIYCNDENEIEVILKEFKEVKE